MIVAESQPKSEGRTGHREHARALAVVLKEEFGVDFQFFDAATGTPVPCGEWAPPEVGSLPELAVPAALDVQALAFDGRAQVLPLEAGGYSLGLLLYQARRPALVAIACIESVARTEAETARERARLERWLQAVGDRLRLTDQFQVRRRHEDERGAPSMAPWEALLNLDQVMRRLRVHKQPEKGRQRILEAAFGLLGVQTLVWVPHQPDELVLFQGEPVLAVPEYRQLVALLLKNPEFRPPGPILYELSPGKSWKNRFPSMTNLMAFQAADQGPLGWMIAINKLADSQPSPSPGPSLPDAPVTLTPFRRTDAALLMPFVALLEMHARCTERYQDLKDLLVGLTRSLTTALDAKDSYTFGHSERVARIAVELGREMGLGTEELGDIYLAGLLHDIGKIGIRDTVLLKPDTLTPEEREHIKQHVTIGYSILADLRQIRNLLPGVLYHHERYDGTGYPDGLAGENIPLLGRILAVADAYDAMSTARPYRDAIPLRKVEEILRGGMGTQWDQQVVEAFLRCRHRIHSVRQRGVGDSLRLAIEGTLRSETQSLGGRLELKPNGNHAGS
jgi:HD-GYP domain-containing protein (c-di-GMP phosphodiesterase class II)